MITCLPIDDRIVRIIEESAPITYAREVVVTGSFEPYPDLYRYKGTLYHHKNWDSLFDMGRKFLEKRAEIDWRDKMILGKPLICVTCTSDALATFGNGAGDKDAKNLGQRKIVLPSAYPRAIEFAGGVPILTSECCVEEMAELCDGLLLTGGEDINPALLGEKKLNDSVKWDDIRDEYELRLFKAFAEREKPIFGICRGFQVINVALGGGLYQDLVEQMGVVHRNNDIRHNVTTTEGSLLRELFGEKFRVNSTHHQAVRELGDGLIPTAWSIEGICEAFCHESRPIFGTQFHPERLTNLLWDDRTPDFEPLFSYFIELCSKGKQKDF